MPVSRKSRTWLPSVPPSLSGTMIKGSPWQCRQMPHREDLVLACYRRVSQLPMPARASQTLRPRYANIERELLAIVFACQRFNTYVLGRPFTVESDHKPLEMIHQKSLASAPPRLQQMLLQLQQYDVTIKYRPGKEMLLADALSRCPSWASGEIKLDMRVDYIAFSKAWIAKLKETTKEDPILGTVYQLTQQGWPHQRRHTLQMARVYWDFRDQLSTDKGLLLMGLRIVIPPCLHEEYLQRLHQGHLSATKVQQNTHQHLYWPGLDADIADYTRRCQECICWSQPPKEPLQAHDVPQESWERIALWITSTWMAGCIFWSVITLVRSPSCFRSRPRVLPTWRTI